MALGAVVVMGGSVPPAPSTAPAATVRPSVAASTGVPCASPASMRTRL